jgi:hypothetical protein
VPGVGPTEADADPWELPCRDAVGRLRVLTVSVTGDGTVALRFPPGESAELGYRGADVLDVAAYAIEMGLR